MPGIGTGLRCKPSAIPRCSRSPGPTSSCSSGWTWRGSWVWRPRLRSSRWSGWTSRSRQSWCPFASRSCWPTRSRCCLAARQGISFGIDGSAWPWICSASSLSVGWRWSCRRGTFSWPELFLLWKTLRKVQIAGLSMPTAKNNSCSVLQCCFGR